MEWWKFSGQKLCALADEVLNKRRATEEELHTAIEQLLEGEKQKYTGAYLRLGRCHEKGIAVPKDDTLAMEYYRMAADRGDEGAEAETQRLNPLYRPKRLSEIGVVEVPDVWAEHTARSLCQAASAENDPEKRAQILQFAIDMECAEGMLLWARELEQRGDEKGALLWYRKAAINGNPEATGAMREKDPLYDPDLPDTDPMTGDQLFELADDYRNGTNRPANEAMFEHLSAMASARNNGKAAMELGWSLYKKGKKEEALPFLKNASEEGFGEATDLLGQMTQQGEAGMMVNDGAAFGLFVKAAEQNSAKGCFHAGQCCESGKGTEQSDKRASEWYLKAANLGEKAAIEGLKSIASRTEDPKIKYRCGHFLLYGDQKGANQDFKTAFAMLSAAAEGRVAEAYYDLGLMYRDGRYVYSKRKAVEYLEKATQLGVNGATSERKKVHRRTIAYVKGVLPTLIIPILVFAAILFVVAQLERKELLHTASWNPAVLWSVAGVAAAGFLVKHYFIGRTYSVRPFWLDMIWTLVFPGAGVAAALILAGVGVWNLFAVAAAMAVSALLTVFLVQHESAVKDALWVGLRLVCFVPGCILLTEVVELILRHYDKGIRIAAADEFAIVAMTLCALILIVKQYYLYSARLDMDNFVVCGVLSLLWPGVFLAGVSVFCWIVMSNHWVLAIGMAVGTLLHCIISENIWGARDSD